MTQRGSTRATPKRIAPPAGFDLSGWKEILPVLAMSEKVARARMVRAERSLPITSWAGRPIAVRAELVEWLATEARCARIEAGRAST